MSLGMEQKLRCKQNIGVIDSKGETDPKTVTQMSETAPNATTGSKAEKVINPHIGLKTKLGFDDSNGSKTETLSQAGTVFKAKEGFMSEGLILAKDATRSEAGKRINARNKQIVSNTATATAVPCVRTKKKEEVVPSCVVSTYNESKSGGAAYVPKKNKKKMPNYKKNNNLVFNAVIDTLASINGGNKHPNYAVTSAPVVSIAQEDESLKPEQAKPLSNKKKRQKEKIKIKENQQSSSENTTSIEKLVTVVSNAATLQNTKPIGVHPIKQNAKANDKQSLVASSNSTFKNSLQTKQSKDKKLPPITAKATNIGLVSSISAAALNKSVRNSNSKDKGAIELQKNQDKVLPTSLSTLLCKSILETKQPVEFSNPLNTAKNAALQYCKSNKVKLLPTPKPAVFRPPIVFDSSLDTGSIMEYIKQQIDVNNISYKFLKQFDLTVVKTKSEEFHNLICRYLIDTGKGYFTYTPKDKRKTLLVLRMPRSTMSIDNIRSKLVELKVPVLNINIFKSMWKSSKSYNLYLVEVHQNAKLQDLFEGKIPNKSVKWSKLKMKSITQCRNCQRYGHVASNCHMQYRCVKCEGGHSVGECPRISRDDMAFCQNCKKNGHPSNYRGCSAYRKQVKALKRQRNKAKAKAAGRMLESLIQKEFSFLHC